MIHENPFDITKAVDFNDEQIRDTWVDLPGEGGFYNLINPRSPVAHVLLGGKGSGRTHLMRYYSFAVQRLRSNGDPLRQLANDGYIGIYVRGEGLNAGRFSGKGQDEEAWLAVFAYYMDLTLALQTITTVCAAAQESRISLDHNALGKDISELVEVPLEDSGDLNNVLRKLRQYQTEINHVVNNAAITRDISKIHIRETRGSLVFGIPKAIANNVEQFRELRFAYLIDELENLTEPQQRYVNTLIREKQIPTTFIVGARLYGFRTQKTLSADEENRAGSEFELVKMDDLLREERSRYKSFAGGLVAKRLNEAGYLEKGLLNVSSDQAARRQVIEAISEAIIDSTEHSFFETIPASRLEFQQTAFVRDRWPRSEDRLHFQKLSQQIQADSSLSPSARDREQLAKDIVRNLKSEDFPLLEKANIFLLYQAWAAKKDILSAVHEIANTSPRAESGDTDPSIPQIRLLGHFRLDFLAQLLRSVEQKQRYLGFDSFVAMSSGLPRNLLIILKFVHKWALFNGENPFAIGAHAKPISIRSQQDGVSQASNWFFEDARSVGLNADTVQGGVERLAGLMRAMRFADKPVESSLATFSYDETLVAPSVRDIVLQAEATSLLIRVYSGERDRNNRGVVAKYQLNPMLAPRYDLPLGRRGTVALTPIEATAIFAPTTTEEFRRIARVRLARMNAPFRATEDSSSINSQPTLGDL